MNPLALIGFIRSPLGRAIGIGIVLLLSHGYAYERGKWKAEATCNAAALQAQVNALKRDLSIAQASERLADRLADQAADRALTLSERLSQYETDAAAGEPDVCLLGDDDVSRLRDLTK